ncbi:hypothetical protein K491DRAFT_780721 [Lophiostoma macrostomum CBS 122681]|uniref:Uncharacterized protein n=1 Tax=Lophiostoma macrostomum CBS 122681 TaxID=1314788 RepID=A0A6A6T223_9PLEO|nr:hypothetical protein K491DRAFT_780721 [Lophiostoma macrostomum CBS 122681]
MATSSDATKIYTLTVYVPDKIPSPISIWWDRKSHPVDYSPSNYNPERDFKIGNGNPKYFLPSTTRTCDLDRDNIPDMKTKEVRIKGSQFPSEFRCSHVLKGAYKCASGCYVLEKGDESLRKCGTEEGNVENPACEGHRWVTYMKMNEDGWLCFGKKGERLICIEEEN